MAESFVTPFRFGFARSGFFFGQLAPRRFELFFDSLQLFRLFDDQIFRGLQLLLKAGLVGCSGGLG